jgi:hypothetical protein
LLEHLSSSPCPEAEDELPNAPDWGELAAAT